MVSALEHKIPATIFINSMSDTFHEKAEEWIEEQFDVMAVASWHTWQVLTCISSEQGRAGQACSQECAYGLQRGESGLVG
jgi:protein gp37